MGGRASKPAPVEDDSCLSRHCDSVGRRTARRPPAEQFEAGIPAVLRVYESRLRLTGSPLAKDGDTMRSCLAHAEAILAECAQSLREQRVITVENRRTMSSEIGVQRASRDIHPVESLRASAVLSELALGLLTESVKKGPNSVHLVTAAAITLNQSIAARVEIAAISYDRFLFEQIKRAQSDITRAMAREIHDHVGNGMSLAHRQLELYDVLRGKDGSTAHHKVTQARRVLTETLDNTRRLVAELRLDVPRTGMREAIEMFVKSVEVPDVSLDIVLNGDERWLPEDISGELFTVIREALRNVFKHACASRVTVRIEVTRRRVDARVQDDGAGFDPALPTSGHGVASMAERTNLLGGRLRVRSKPGAGTSIDVSIPIRQEQDHLAHR